MKRNYIVFLVLALAVVGCKLPGFLSGGGGGSSAGGKGTATGGADPKADVIEASKRFIALPSFRANMEGMGITEIKTQVEYLAPDRFRIKNLLSEMEMIYIGKDLFIKSGDKWTKAPGSGQSVPNLRDSFTEEGLKTLSDVKYEGEETVNGVATSVYSYKNVTPVGDFPFTSKIWIRGDTGVPLKIFVEYTNNQALKHMTVNYDTDAKITIEPPIK